MKQNLVQNALGLYNWQATKMTVKERLAFLFNNNILSDVTFVVGRDVHQQRIPAHRFVLSVGSAVFDAMFNRHSSKTGTSATGKLRTFLGVKRGEMGTCYTALAPIIPLHSTLRRK